MKQILAVLTLLTLLRTSSFGATITDFDPQHIPVITLGSYPPSLKPGTGMIDGYLKAKTQTFGEITYADEEVLLIPNSEFSMWYIKDVAYMMENPDAKDAIANYPIDLVKYTRTVKSDDNGYFRFSGLPSGKYYVWTYLEHEVDSHPTRERTQLAMGADGQMVSVPTFRKGLKIRTDNVVIAANASIDGPKDRDEIESFAVVGEFTCCSAEI